jgi:hypothetical protein
VQTDPAGRGKQEATREATVGVAAGSGGGEADPAADPGATSCAVAFSGPLLVVILERVQSGLLGAALSSMGITGLYITFVFGE